MTEIYFDEDIAAHYDATCADQFLPEIVEPTVTFLSELAHGGAALELGVGTGRVALPLSEHCAVHGIDNSEAMLSHLRAKEGSARVALTRGDLATTRVDGSFHLVYLVFNTIMNLTTQELQVACFRNAAAHLGTGGAFVVEVLVPVLNAGPQAQRFRVFDSSEEHLGYDEITDFAAQTLTSHHYWTNAHGTRRFSAPFRYVWPSELDLMAQLAGLRLEGRWADWKRSPFTDRSTSHISVWRKD